MNDTQDSKQPPNRRYYEPLDQLDADVRVSRNLAMYEEQTRSVWSRLIGRAICWPITGTILEVVSTMLTT